MKNKFSIAINNITVIIILGQVFAYLAINSGMLNYNDLFINYNLIKSGEVWRIFTFLFIPPSTSPIWSVLSWYILYLMGNNLEHYWGARHYNIYILVAIVLTNITALLFNLSVGTNYYFQSSIFLAFAFLNPNFTVRLFFLIPIKIKWIAIATWVLYLKDLIFGSNGAKILIVASLTNFIIFFAKEIYLKIKYRGKNIKHKIEKEVTKNRPLHECAACSKNSINSPYMDFRYCSSCNPEQCYCEEHINNHEHQIDGE